MAKAVWKRLVDAYQHRPSGTIIVKIENNYGSCRWRLGETAESWSHLGEAKRAIEQRLGNEPA